MTLTQTPIPTTLAAVMAASANPDRKCARSGRVFSYSIECFTKLFLIPASHPSTRGDRCNAAIATVVDAVRGVQW